MSNRRIDLTPFEGMTKGEWVYHEGEDGAAWLGTLLIPHIGAETPEHPHGTPYPVLSASGHGYHLTRSDIKAMAAVPELIAELKRMYERETELLTALQVIKEYTNESQSMDNIKDYVNNACDTNLPYWGCACQGPHTGPC